MSKARTTCKTAYSVWPKAANRQQASRLWHHLPPPRATHRNQAAPRHSGVRQVPLAAVVGSPADSKRAVLSMACQASGTGCQHPQRHHGVGSAKAKTQHSHATQEAGKGQKRNIQGPSLHTSATRVRKDSKGNMKVFICTANPNPHASVVTARKDSRSRSPRERQGEGEAVQAKHWADIPRDVWWLPSTPHAPSAPPATYTPIVGGGVGGFMRPD